MVARGRSTSIPTERKRAPLPDFAVVSYLRPAFWRVPIELWRDPGGGLKVAATSAISYHNGGGRFSNHPSSRCKNSRSANEGLQAGTKSR